MKKRLLIVLLIGILTISLTGCGNNNLKTKSGKKITITKSVTANTDMFSTSSKN